MASLTIHCEACGDENECIYLYHLPPLICILLSRDLCSDKKTTHGGFLYAGFCINRTTRKSWAINNTVVFRTHITLEGFSLFFLTCENTIFPLEFEF